MSSTIKSIM